MLVWYQISANHFQAFTSAKNRNKMSEQQNGVGPSSAEGEQNAEPNANNNSFSSHSAYLAWTQYWQHYYYTYSFYYYSSYYYYFQCQQGQAIHLQNSSAFSPISAGQISGNGSHNLPQVINRGLNRANTAQQHIGRQTPQPLRK